MIGGEGRVEGLGSWVLLMFGGVVRFIYVSGGKVE